MISYSYKLSSIPGFTHLIKGDSAESNILKLHRVECRTSNNASYSIVRYDKNLLAADLIPTYGLCRSVIVNSNNDVVGFSPPKSIKSENFIQRYSPDAKGVVAEEFVEGTMINVFWDSSIGINGSWEISTRNTVGATSTFYKGANTKTFREMFLEAAKECNLEIAKLDTKYCYSFVLQHPENRIVVPFKKPQLYLIGMYFIVNEFDNCYVHVGTKEGLMEGYFINDLKTTVKFPEVYKFNSYAELIEKYGSMNTRYDIVGVMLHNISTGERTKIRNPVYEQVRNLRGNQPKLQYQYLSLRKEGKVGEFLKFYPENKKEFSAFRDQVHLFTETLFNNYVACYIKKEKPLGEYPDKYRTHMYNIHQKYINELKEKKHYVNNTFVQKYVNELHPSLLMFCLNHDLRKRNVDTIAAEHKE
jgi:hypothetical protein